MKTKHFIALSLFALALCANASPSWTALYTTAYAGDETPSTAGAANYSTYYCTAASAQSMFGATTVDGIDAYLMRNFTTGKSALAASGTALTSGDYAAFDNRYTFLSYFGAPVVAGSYVAVTFYQDEAFRVYGADNALIDSGNMTFTDKNAGTTVGDWQTVPEPTSGLLSLFAFAALALRRKSRPREQVG